ncbi:putative ATP-dependent RNA helicase DDX20 [Brachionus plicatilis]|uniref:RNA helicase n=1 Tax=Brachionus plicatilis TaxID=10195 RepID=A0A3M7S7I2_BRAPC|nr:putative ATP-dependent RNA helicase DDX20 [Brachionus plicatilis]
MQNPVEFNLKKRTKDIELDENVTFDDLMLSKPVLDGLRTSGFLKPSPIQLKAIPIGKLGLDLIVQAKSGTGKTCVFSILSLEQILASKSKALQVLVLAPTREVAIQISDCVKAIGHNFAKCQVFIGGQSINQDKTKVKNCQIAIGTPGRILHLIDKNLLNTTNIRLFILDEADKLLEPEFQDSINLIYSKMPLNKQMIFLSATYPTFMASYATRYMRSPTYVRLNIVDPSLRGIKQYYKITSFSKLQNKCFDAKTDELCKILGSVQFQQAIVFVNYQLKAESLSSTLNERGWHSIYTSGHIEQHQRNFAMNQLKQFKCRILVSTDLVIFF